MEAKELAELIETRLLGIEPDEQDIVLEDSDWQVIVAALRRTPSHAEGGDVAGAMSRLREAIAEQEGDAADGAHGEVYLAPEDARALLEALSAIQPVGGGK